jgi:hypothetical protein
MSVGFGILFHVVTGSFIFVKFLNSAISKVKSKLSDLATAQPMTIVEANFK